MKKLISLTLAIVLPLLFLCRMALAVPAYPGSLSVTDASGTTFSVQNNGDEFFSYITDENGNLLICDAAGYYCYVAAAPDGSFALGDPAGGGFMRWRRSLLGERVNVRKAAPGWQQKLTDLYSALAAPAPALFSLLPSACVSACVPIPDGYDHNSSNPNDPLYQKWLRPFTHPAIPEKATTCPLLVLKVSFADIPCLFSDAAWHKRVFDDGVAAYYTENSNRQFTYVPAQEAFGENDGVVHVTLPIDHPGFTLKDTGQSYGNGLTPGLYAGNDGRSYAIYGNQSLYAYALEAADPYVNFAAYDRTGDGVISPTELAVVLVVAGYEASFVGIKQGAPMIWASSWCANSFLRVASGPQEGDIVGDWAAVVLDEKKLYKFTLLGENLNGAYDYSLSPSQQQEKPIQAEIGTLCHELGHDLGLMDLYDTSLSDNQTAEVLGLSLMASGSWGYWDGYPGSSPSHLDPFSKIRLGFYTPQIISQPGAYPVTEASDSARYNILRLNTQNPDVYYLIENRTFTGFDKGMFYPFNPPGGAVYWRIDDGLVRQRYDMGTVNNEPGNYGVMPAYLTYDPIANWLSQPFRNDRTYPLQNEFAIRDSLKKLVCFDPSAPTVNVWLNALYLKLAPAGAFEEGEAPDEWTATLDALPGLTLADLLDVRMDGARLSSPDQFTARSGSIIVALPRAYLNTLRAGTHTLRATLANGLFAEGQIDVMPRASAVPPTGDAAQPGAWLLLSLLAFGGACACLRGQSGQKRYK